MDSDKEKENLDVKNTIPENPFSSGEIRTDYRTGLKVVSELSRKNRPSDYLIKDVIDDKGKENCPFEPEKYDLNKTLFEIGNPWRVRVIYNKYPIFQYNAPYAHEKWDIFERSTNYGFSFVIIDSREHNLKFEQFDEANIRDLAKAILETEKIIYEHQRIDFVYLNKNFGRKSGGTLSHSHWQTLGYTDMPEMVKARLSKVMEFRDRYGSCLMEYAAKKEEERKLLENDTLIAFAPFAQLYTGESVVMPKRHVNMLSELSENEMIKLLKACQKIIIANNGYFKVHSYNILGYSLKEEKEFHSYVEIVPRVSDIGPMQMADYYGNNVMPEEYSKEIRAILSNF